MKRTIFALILSAILVTGCATAHRSDTIDVRALPETQQARDYLKNGQYKEGIESYQKLIASNPKHFKSVLFQHEIMEYTSSLNDPYLLIQEIERTIKLYHQAHYESFEGATPEALELERQKLIKFIYNTGYSMDIVYQNTQMESYHTISIIIFETGLSLFKNIKGSCRDLSIYAQFYYHSEHYKDAKRLYDKVLNECEDKLTDYPNIYVNSAEFGMMSEYYIMQELINSEDPSCPKIKDELDDSTKEIPIADCRMNFLKAYHRFTTVLKKYPNKEINERVINFKLITAIMYYDHNQFDNALPLFFDIFENNPKTKTAVIACYKIIETYLSTKQYKKAIDFLHNVKLNNDFMSNTSDEMNELLAIIRNLQSGLYEDALFGLLGFENNPKYSY